MGDDGNKFGPKAKTTPTSSFQRHTYGETRSLTPELQRLNTATRMHGEQRRYESWRDAGRSRIGGGRKPVEALTVTPRERIGGGPGMTVDMASGDRNWNWHATKPRQRIRCTHRRPCKEPELMIATTAWLSHRNSTCK